MRSLEDCEYKMEFMFSVSKRRFQQKSITKGEKFQSREERIGFLKTTSVGK